MGKKDKEHRKRVQARNARLKLEEKKRAKMFEELMMKQIDAYKEQMSAETETRESIEVQAQEIKSENSITIDVNGPIQPSETL